MLKESWSWQCVWKVTWIQLSWIIDGIVISVWLSQKVCYQSLFFPPELPWWYGQMNLANLLSESEGYMTAQTPTSMNTLPLFNSNLSEHHSSSINLVFPLIPAFQASLALKPRKLPFLTTLLFLLMSSLGKHFCHVPNLNPPQSESFCSGGFDSIPSFSGYYFRTN